MAWDESALADVEQSVAGCRLAIMNLEVSPPVIARAVRAARRAGARVILNPAPHRKGDEACFSEVDCFVPNQVEAALFAGRELESVEDWEDIGRRLRALGPRAVVVTLGAEGCLIVSDEGTTRVPGFKVPIVDTTAAGDAFVGGLATALLRGATLPGAVRYANACGALAATKAGAQPSLPQKAEVEQLLAGAERS
jgi:ribokinase